VTKAATHRGEWDCTVALAYATEQLFRVSQLANADIGKSAEALALSYAKCIASVLQHENLLPNEVVLGLRHAQQHYLEMERPNISKAQCNSLAALLTAILREISGFLAASKLRVAA
jgi:1,6-anhydro-N-acetylmuramate kinase